MAMLDLVNKDPSMRYRIKRAMFDGRYSAKASSYTTPLRSPIRIRDQKC